MKFIVLRIIRLYQQLLSPPHGFLSIFTVTGPNCRFTPTCSEYTYQAVSRYGIIYGLWLGIRRINRCHPGNAGGHDPLP